MNITTDLELLNKKIINTHLAESALLANDCVHNYTLEILASASSTNDYLLELVKRNKINNKHYIVLAEEQTAGRGRGGNKWESPFAKNLYMSFYYKFYAGHDAVSGLSLVIGIAVVQALQAIGLRESLIKWPNDIYYKDAKLSGLLIETSRVVSTAAAINAVIGIGINVSGADVVQNKIAQQCTDIVTAMGKSVSRNLLAALVIREVMVSLEKFQQQGLAGFLSAWDQLDMLYGKQVEITLADTVQRGIAAGINSKGALVVSIDGEKCYFNTGTVREC